MNFRFSLTRLPALVAVSMTACSSVAHAAVGADLNALASAEKSLAATIYLKPGGDDTKDGQTPEKAVATLRRAVLRASDIMKTATETEKKNVKVFISNGTYECADRTGNTVSNDSLLVIEGESTGGVILQRSAKTGDGSQIIYMPHTKSNFVLRNVTVSATAPGLSGFSTGAASYSPRPAAVGKNWLIENCVFQNNGKEGAYIYHPSNVTIRNCKFNDNGREGLRWIATDSLIEKCEANNNSKLVPGAGEYVAGGFTIYGVNLVCDGLTANDNNNGPGFRQDHVAENMTIKNSTFKGNKGGYKKGYGMFFETVVGPVTIENCRMEANEYVGLELATAHNVTVSKCQFVNNGTAGLKITAKKRSQTIAGIGQFKAGDLMQAEWVDKKPIEFTLNTVFNGNTISTDKGDESYLIMGAPGETHAPGYENWWKSEFSGAGSTLR